MVDTLDEPLMCIKFSNEEDAVSCQDALLHQCDLMNALYDENEQLKISLSACAEKNRRLQTILDKLGYEYIGDLK